MWVTLRVATKNGRHVFMCLQAHENSQGNLISHVEAKPRRRREDDDGCQKHFNWLPTFRCKKSLSGRWKKKPLEDVISASTQKEKRRGKHNSNVRSLAVNYRERIKSPTEAFRMLCVITLRNRNSLQRAEKRSSKLMMRWLLNDKNVISANWSIHLKLYLTTQQLLFLDKLLIVFSHIFFQRKPVVVQYVKAM